MFSKHIGKNFEAYIDDMVIKSKKSKDHVSDMEEIFGIFRKFRMKLNPLSALLEYHQGNSLGMLLAKGESSLTQLR